jgi:hypothetical protein
LTNLLAGRPTAYFCTIFSVRVCGMRAEEVEREERMLEAEGSESWLWKLVAAFLGGEGAGAQRHGVVANARVEERRRVCGKREARWPARGRSILSSLLDVL